MTQEKLSYTGYLFIPAGTTMLKRFQFPGQFKFYFIKNVNVLELQVRAVIDCLPKYFSCSPQNAGAKHQKTHG